MSAQVSSNQGGLSVLTSRPEGFEDHGNSGELAAETVSKEYIRKMHRKANKRNAGKRNNRNHFLSNRLGEREFWL